MLELLLDRLTKVLDEELAELHELLLELVSPAWVLLELLRSSLLDDEALELLSLDWLVPDCDDEDEPLERLTKVLLELLDELEEKRFGASVTYGMTELASVSDPK